MQMIFFGPPGVGKGTIAGIISKELSILHISTGQLLRDNVEAKTPLGLQVKSIMDRGELVPDTIMISMLQQLFEKSPELNGYVLDGFPRTVKQAEALSSITSIDYVFNFTCSMDILIQRLSGRRFCPSCGQTYHVTNRPPKKEGLCDNDGTLLQIRKDDAPEAIEKRIQIYNETMPPLIDWYTQRDLLQNLDSSIPAELVVKEIMPILDRPLPDSQ